MLFLVYKMANEQGRICVHATDFNCMRTSIEVTFIWSLISHSTKNQKTSDFVVQYSSLNIMLHLSFKKICFETAPVRHAKVVLPRNPGAHTKQST